MVQTLWWKSANSRGYAKVESALDLATVFELLHVQYLKTVNARLPPRAYGMPVDKFGVSPIVVRLNCKSTRSLRQQLECFINVIATSRVGWNALEVLHLLRSLVEE